VEADEEAFHNRTGEDVEDKEAAWWCPVEAIKAAEAAAGSEAVATISGP
jgi:hypothetical protein